MTPKQHAEMDRLRKRVAMLEQRNRELSLSFPKGSVDRFAWLVNEIEAVCPKSGVRGSIRVSHSDARLVRPILEAIVAAKGLE
jgi:hypothetical protein